MPADRLDVLTHYLPAEELADASRAHQGRYVLAAGRLSAEKGLDLAIEAAALAGVPLWIAGDGPAAAELAQLARRLAAPVELLGAVPRDADAGRCCAAPRRSCSARAATSSRPSRCWRRWAPACRSSPRAAAGVPELIGAERCVPMADAAALAEAMRALWSDPDRRRREGGSSCARARERHSEQRYLRDLLAIYASSRSTAAQ